MSVLNCNCNNQNTKNETANRTQNNYGRGLTGTVTFVEVEYVSADANRTAVPQILALTPPTGTKHLPVGVCPKKRLRHCV